MKLLSALFCVPLVSHAAAAATRVTFDDLSPGPAGSYIAIPNGYGGLQWSGFGVLNGTLTSPPSGYQYGIVSPDNVAFNYDEFDRTASISSGSPFNLDSAYLTAQIVNGMQVEVQGFVDTQLIYDNTYTLNESSPSFIAFGYTGITGVRFLPVNPVTIFVMDNLTVSAVPEPSTNGLLIFGAAWLGLGSLVNRHAKEQSRG